MSPTSMALTGLCLLPLLLILGLAVMRTRSGSGAPKVPPDLSPNEEPWSNVPLHRRATRALVDLDNAVKASAEELAFARAQVGDHAVAGFRRAVDSAEAKVDAAFQVLHELEEDQPRRSALRGVERARLEEVLELARAADAELEAQEAAFDRLRDLRAQVPEFLASLRLRAQEVIDRIPVAEQVLDGVRALHSAESLTTPIQDLEQATRLTDAALELTVRGEQHVAADDRTAAVSAARTAEEALGQADELLTSVINTPDELEAATAAIDGALVSLASLISEGDKITAIRQMAIFTEAQQALNESGGARQGGDVIGALARLERVEHHLDTALETHRQRARRRAERASRNREWSSSGPDHEQEPVVVRRIRHVRRRVTRAAQLVHTRRGHLSYVERKLVAESRRLVVQAETTRDGRRAADLLTQAEDLADRAYEAATNTYDYDKDRVLNEEKLFYLAFGLAMGGISAGNSSSSSSRGGGFGSSTGGFGGGGRF